MIILFGQLIIIVVCLIFGGVGVRYYFRHKREEGKYTKCLFAVSVSCICFGIAVMFALNLMYFLNLFSFSSDLDDNGGFSIVVAFLTFMAAFLIAVIQMLKQTKESFEVKKQAFNEKIGDVVQKTKDKISIYNYLNNDLYCFTKDVHDIFNRSDNEKYFVISMGTEYFLSYHNLSITQVQITNSEESNDKRPCIIGNDCVKVKNGNIYILVNTEEAKKCIFEAIMQFLNYFTRNNVCFGIEIFFSEIADPPDTSQSNFIQKYHLSKNKNRVFSASVRFDVQMISLRGKPEDSLIVMDGLCEGKIINKTVHKITFSELPQTNENQ